MHINSNLIMISVWIQKFSFRKYFNTQSEFPQLFCKPYESTEVESKWRRIWKAHPENQSLRIKENTSKNFFYSLAMFPYPSGILHIGHARVYTISDLLSKAYRMKGYEVLHPMGWDAFGLPAENAAIEKSIQPNVWTRKNIEQMKEQMEILGFNFDWDRELSTCDPDYYKWTQWIFIQMFKKGLAYQKESFVNWDPVDQTVLANEQVDKTGCSWRSGTIVERKLMRQWYWKITEYADALLEDLDALSGWPMRVKKMQREWLGRSQGVVVRFPTESLSTHIDIYTTRIETIFGVTFIALAPDNQNVSILTTEENKKNVSQFLEQFRSTTLRNIDPKRKKVSGIFLGSYAINPLNKEKIPIFLAEYVLSEYGTGAIMGVPAHDIRDWGFSNEFNLPLKQVLTVQGENPEKLQLPFTATDSECEFTLINSNEFSGKSSTEAIEILTKLVETKGWGKIQTFWNIRDWLISRQRYWGTPIPIIYCNICGTVPVPEDQLPVKLPIEGVNFKEKGSPLKSVDSWTNCKCPLCGENAKRETDTMDTFVDSSWYYMRFADVNNQDQPFSLDAAKKWLPVNLYVGGNEHAILHLLYARFINKFFYDLNLVPSKEPFKILKTQGMVHGKTYRTASTNVPISSSFVVEKGPNAFHSETGEPLVMSWEKMSKSKYNGVDPRNVVLQYGADTIRLFLLFKAPIDQVIDWDINQIQGQLRWLNRIWTLIQHYQLYKYFNNLTFRKTTSLNHTSNITQQKSYNLSVEELRKNVYKTIKEVTKNVFEDHSFNVAISKLMTLSNILSDIARADENYLCRSFEYNPLLESFEFKEGLDSLLIMLTPMAPHFTSEAYQLLEVDALSHNLEIPEKHILLKNWPEYCTEDTLPTVETEKKMNVHINGKIRKGIEINSSLCNDQNELISYLTAHDGLRKFIEGKDIKKVICLKNKGIINIIL